MTNIHDVIIWKFDSQPGMTIIDGEIVEFPDGIPSTEDQEKWTLEYENHLIATKYQKDRVEEYPELKEQLDMIYHDKKNETDNWFEMINMIKERYPKTS